MKQVIVVRKDLNLSKGKMAAQVAHASLGAYRKAGKERREWENEGEKKVVVGAEEEKELFQIKQNAEDLGIPCYLVKDAGRTEIPRGTVTALAVGPVSDSKADKVTGHLPLVN